MIRKEFETNLCCYQIIETADGSYAIYSSEYDENSHSDQGARSETLYNFVEGCDLSTKWNEAKCSVLEVGFGIGNGLAVTYDKWKDYISNTSKDSEKKIVHFYTQEIDPQLVDYALKVGPYAEDLIDFNQTDTFEYLAKFKGNEFKLDLLLGDARDTIAVIPEASIDAIFQDAYSPGKNPTLWTKEWFSDLYQVAAEDCVMSTYSASARMRKAMVMSTWKVYNKKGFSKKRSMTIALKSGATEAFFENRENECLNAQILKSNLEPLRDEDL